MEERTVNRLNTIGWVMAGGTAILITAAIVNHAMKPDRVASYSNLDKCNRVENTLLCQQVNIDGKSVYVDPNDLNKNHQQFAPAQAQNGVPYYNSINGSGYNDGGSSFIFWNTGGWGDWGGRSRYYDYDDGYDRAIRDAERRNRTYTTPVSPTRSVSPRQTTTPTRTQTTTTTPSRRQDVAPPTKPTPTTKTTGPVTGRSSSGFGSTFKSSGSGGK